MAVIIWANESSQTVKWIVINKDYQAQSDALDAGQAFKMDDTGLNASGWSLSGFTGIAVSALPDKLSSPISAYNLVVDTLPESEELSSKLKNLAVPK
jgi:hypothetical protein